MNLKSIHRKDKGGILIIVLIGTVVAAIIISSYMQVIRTSLQSATRIRGKIASDSLASGGLDQVRFLLQQSAKSGTSLLSDIHTAGTSGFEIVELEGDSGNFRKYVKVIEELGNPPSLDLGPMNYRVFSSVEQIDTGTRFTVQSSIALARDTYAKLTFGMIHPSTAGPFNFSPTLYSGDVHFGNFGTNKINFVDGNHDFKGHVTFESSDPTPFTSGYYANVNFENGYEIGSTMTSSFDPTAVMNSVCSKTTSTFSDWLDPGEDLCLFFKDNTVERYACASDVSTGDAATAYGTFREARAIPASGLILCSNRNVGVKGIYSTGVTIASQQNLILWGDFVSRHQKSATYSAGLIAKNNIVIPADVPIDGYYAAPIDGLDDHYSYTEDNGATWKFWMYRFPYYSGVTNFPADYQFAGYPAATVFRDENLGNRRYGMHPVIGGTAQSLGLYHCSYLGLAMMDGYDTACIKVPGILDIDASVMAVDGILDVANLNRKDKYPDGRLIPGNDGKLYLPDFTDPDPTDTILPFYNDVDLDGKITLGTGSPDSMATNGKYCALWGGWMPDCQLGSQMPRPNAERIWINGGLIVKDFSNTYAFPCAYAHSGGMDWWVQCGFDEKAVIYNPLLRRFPPPGFPSPNNNYNVFVNWTKAYVDQLGPSNFHL